MSVWVIWVCLSCIHVIFKKVRIEILKESNALKNSNKVADEIQEIGQALLSTLSSQRQQLQVMRRCSLLDGRLDELV